MNNKIKTIGAIMLAAAMCASFAGCAKKDDNGVYVDKDGNVFIDESKFEDHVNSVFGGETANGSSSEASKPDPKPLDPFEEFEVTFEGISPKITAKIKEKDPNVNYTLSKERELQNGGKITVEAELSLSKKDDYILTSDSKEITVEGRPYYIMELSELTEGDIEKLSKNIADSLDEYVLTFGAGSTVNSLDFIGNINLVKDNINYRTYFVYNANVTFTKTNETKEYVFAAYYNHIYKETDGTLVYSDGQAKLDSSGDMSVKCDIFYVAGAFASVDTLNAHIARFGAEKESNVKVL